MGGIGGPELLVIFLVVLLVFGPRKIPEVARGVGKGLREIRKLTTEFQREMNLSDAEDERRRIGGERPGGAPGPHRAGGMPRAESAAPQPPPGGPEASEPAESPADPASGVPDRKADGGAPG